MQLNIIALILSLIYSYLFGAVWYTIIFKRPWYDLRGVIETKPKFNEELLGSILAVITFSLSIVGFSLLYTLLQPILTIETTAPGWVHGYVLASFIWVCFIVPSGLLHVLFVDKPVKLWLIDSFFWFGNLVGVATIISFWR